MNTSTCVHCGRSIYWFARHSHWLHLDSRCQACDPAVRITAEPVRA